MDNITRIYFDFLCNIFQLLFVLELIKNIAHVKLNKWKVSIFFFLMLIYSIPETIPFGSIIGSLITILCIVCFCYPDIKKSIQIALIYEICSYFLPLVISCIHSILLLDFRTVIDNPYYLTCKVTLSIALIYILYCLFSNRRRMKSFQTHYQNLFTFVILAISFALSYLTLFICKTQEMDTPIIPVLFSALFILIIICIHIYQRFIDLMTENTQSQILLEQSQMTADYSTQIESNLTELKNLRHDIKNHLRILDGYACEDDYDAIHDYISNITYNYTDAPLFHTVSDVVSALLNTKYQSAQQKGIRFDIIYEFPYLHVDDFSIITILGNLIDNAITAADKCENGWISLSLTQMDSYLEIHIRNNHKEIISERNGEFQTTKTDNKSLHGLGIKNIRSTVKQLNGQIDITHSDKEFDVNILIPNY